jgi:hypothetical protein
MKFDPVLAWKLQELKRHYALKKKKGSVAHRTILATS